VSSGSGSTIQPEVSVVIPTRDRWRLLSRTVACVRRQEGVRLEIVVVDDGSTDGTAEKLRGLGDPRIRTVRHDHSLGLAKARNSGIGGARGAWIAFLDDDDLWSPQKLLRQLLAARSAQARWCYSPAAFVDLRGRPLYIMEPPAPSSILLTLRGANAIPAGASNVLVCADLLDSVGHFDEGFRHFADWDLWIRLATTARPATTHEPLLAYVQHPGNMRLTEPEVLIGELDRLDAKHGLAGDAEPGRFAILRWIAEAQWQAGQRAAAARTFARLLRAHRAPSDVIWVARRVRPRHRDPRRSVDRSDSYGTIEWLDRAMTTGTDR
jgi:glycosyltransferase involved in cell wall biosynthesis